MTESNFVPCFQDSLSISSEQGSLESLPGKHQVKKVEFAPLPLSLHKKSTEDVQLNLNSSIRDGLVSPSLTPLVSSKAFFDSENNLANIHTESKKPEEGSNNNPPDGINDIEKEFDDLSTVRALKPEEGSNQKLVLSKNSFPVALEPKVLVLNWTQNDEKNRMGTLNEDDHESSVETASVMTEDTEGSGSIPNIEKLMINLKQLGQSELDDARTKEHQLKSVMLNTEKAKEEKIKKKVEFKEDPDVLESKNELMKSLSSGSVPLKDAYSSNGSDISEGRDSFAATENIGERKGLKTNLPENREFARDRSASIGTLNLKTPITQLIGDQNRTMLFQVPTALHYILLNIDNMIK